MGNLKPGATYTHEQVGNVVYATDVSSGTKNVTGWYYDKTNPNFDPRTNDGRPLREHLMDDKLWGEIRRAAKTNEALQVALDHAIIVYHLSKDNGK